MLATDLLVEGLKYVFLSYIFSYCGFVSAEPIKSGVLFALEYQNVFSTFILLAVL
jgi:hypothetical protein